MMTMFGVNNGGIQMSMSISITVPMCKYGKGLDADNSDVCGLCTAYSTPFPSYLV